MNHPFAWISASAVVAATAGCAPTSPNFDQHFGESVRVLQAQQVYNPTAPVANRDKVPDGMDGRAARETIERYQRTFIDAPRSSNVFNIGVGGGSSEGGGGSGAR